MRTTLLLLGIFYFFFLAASSLAASSPFDEASAAYARGDYVQAMKRFRQLAEQGHQWAQRRLGSMYAEGKGVPQDYQEAVKWYRLAAAQGHESAELHLGMMYVEGRGVPQDLLRAYMWLDLAASGSSGETREQATKNRARSASKLTAAQVETAQQMARRCRETRLADCG